ncbi:tRNA (adenosine(37)-N6)-threonylcarbamoyltransferase complex ATPase subunit type 1 TsaE [Humibacter ginsenosidimutans]|uniref:tRNA threonylcarbamoyladenosine biosynthesis protein TsaE n=1 Tax=Humibacter ginsenosidimutans TaxID=2599293 RepID=A0A5B8M5Q7_9MICO|nr:tRNA (adenosine(37)-N6)-threonylcarbamoyltransferase complex ATPase subunit type 1 TsaE [Humibacter ginsenosidimutans]
MSASDGRGPAASQFIGAHTVATSEAMEEFGHLLGSSLRAGDLLVLTGPLGAGKTTLTRGIGEGLNVRGPVTSPTFVLARTHPSLAGGPPLVHVDAYRLGSALELDDLDIDFARSVVVVEWGSGMLDGVAESWLDVTIERPTGGDASSADTAPTDADAARDDDEDAAPEEPRTVTITPHGPRWA